MNESFTSTVKAGRLIQMFGWVNLCFTLAIGAMVAVLGTMDTDVTVEWDALVFAWAGLVSLVYLLVGAGVKEYRTWARIAGAVLAVYCLLSVPIGTLIGVCILVYLVRGWKEATAATAAAPA
jgi:hypothetical protein